MSRVASNPNVVHYNNGVNPANKNVNSRSSSTSSSANSIANRPAITVRSAAPAPVHKETVHACPLCNKEYKDPRVLPCTHTYCFNCIREKLISNQCVTCPKCHYQAHPFEETDLQELPRNLILSQEWRIGARPMPLTTTSQKPVPYQANVTNAKVPLVELNQTQPQQREQKTTEKRQSMISETNGHYLTPTTSVNSHGIAALVPPPEQASSTQPTVSNLIKIYSEATKPKSHTQEIRAPSPPAQHFDELTRIVREAAQRIEQGRTPSPSKRSEVREGFTWDNLVHGSPPVAPPLPPHLQSTRSSPERPTMAPQHHSPSRVSFRDSASPERSPVRVTTVTNGHAHSPVTRLSPIPVPIIERTPPRATVILNRAKEVIETGPSPSPKQLETLDLTEHGTMTRRSPSPLFHHSSNHANHHQTTYEHSASDDTKFLRTERFNPQTERSSQMPSGFSTPSNSVEHDRSYSRSSHRYQSPSSPSSMTIAMTTRVDVLLADQQRLEQDIQEQIKRLKYDYDDIRHQIDRKQTAIHSEVNSIATHLDDDITQHYHRKEKIYHDLAIDNRTVGSELERLKADSDRYPTNKQQLWDNLQQIEHNIQSIRQAVDQYKEIPNALTLSSEGQRNLLTPPTVTNVAPYKYVRIDQLSNLEPEAIALADNNKKILVGICNKLFVLNEYGGTLKVIPIAPSIRGIAVSKRARFQNIVYVSHDETVSMIDIDSGQTLDCVRETDSNGESGTFLPLGIDTDNLRGDVYVCDYRNSCVIKFDDKLEFLTQWRVFNHSEQYDEARPKLLSIHGHHLYMIVEHSCKSQYNRGIAYTFSLHVCDVYTGNIIKIIDADLLSSQRLRWPCSIQAINETTCYILDTMTSGKYFNGQWQKHWSRVLEIHLNQSVPLKELFQLDSEATTMALNGPRMIITANAEILFVNLGHLSN